jgi:AraC-like DNA-binding protein
MKPAMPTAIQPQQLLADLVKAVALPAPQGVYGPDQSMLAWSDQGALLEAFAHSRGLDRHDWLAAAGLRSAPSQLSPRQLVGLLLPLLRLGQDAAFVLGQLCLPGHCGLASQALQQSRDTLQATERLSAWCGRLLPLMQLRPVRDAERLWLLFSDACGLPAAHRAALVDLHFSAVTSFCNWRAGERLPWQFHFNRTAPRERGQHVVLLGERLQFDCQLDALSLPLAVARQAWTRERVQPGADLAADALAQGVDVQARRRGALAQLREAMLLQLAEGAVSQERLALQMGVSLATLKRQFAAQGTHWQAELDTLRVQLALGLRRQHGLRAAELSHALGFVDPSNFRRSLKRWTGLAALAS